MANVLKHRFASAKANGPDATQIQPSHWNDGHAFSGGNNNDVLTRDTGDATYGAKWAPIGAWNDVPFSAGNYAGSGSMIWTVDSADQVTYSWTLLGNNTGLILFNLADTTLSGSPATICAITLPMVPLRSTDILCYGVNVGSIAIVRARVIASDPHIYLYRNDGANWTLGGANYMSGQIFLRV